MNLFAKCVQPHRPVSELYDARLYFGKIQYFVDQLQQPFVVGVYNLVILPPFLRIVTLRDDARESYDGIEGRAYFVAHVGKESRLQFVRCFRFLFRFYQFTAHQFQLGDVPFDADNDGREVLAFHHDFLLVENQQISVFVLALHNPVHPFSGSGNFHILFPLLLCHFRRVVVEVVHSDGVF